MPTGHQISMPYTMWLIKQLQSSVSTLVFNTTYNISTIWLKSAVMICCPPPNSSQNLIKGHVQMNLWSANENTAGKILSIYLVTALQI